HGHRVGRCLVGLPDEPVGTVDSEDTMAEHLDKRLLAYVLDDKADQVVVGVRVLDGDAGGMANRWNEREYLLERPDTIPVRLEALLHRGVPIGDSRAMAQELSDGGSVGVEVEVHGEVIGGGCVERDLARLDEL